MFYTVIYIVILLAIILHLLISKQPKTIGRVSEIILLYLLFFGVGISGIYGFIGHAFLADQVAHYIGWPAGNPFQFEVAVANLGYGIAGLLAIKFRGNFWFALIVYYSTFALGAGYGHIHQIILSGNMNAGNAGLPLFLDILKPVLLISLFIIYKLKNTRPRSA